MEQGDARWEQLRRDARKIEGELDVKLSAYAKLGAMLAHRDSASTDECPSWNSMEVDIQSLLEKLLDLNDSMSRCVASATSTPSITQKLARHRDILHEFTQEFRRTRGNINSMREHAELLSSVRHDIGESKASGSVSPGASLLRERAAIHGSILQIEDVINHAQATKGALAAQRTTLLDIQSKMIQLSGKFPVIRSVLGAIRRKRSRDTLILSAIISLCIVFLLLYWMTK